MTRPRRNEYGTRSEFLEAYLAPSRRVALLSADEERELATAVGRGDPDARAQLIRANLRLVATIARDYLGRGLVLDDLIGEGNIGLIQAAERFDPGFGVRFSTYAAHWVRRAIREALTKTAAPIRLPAHMVKLLAQWRQAEAALERALGRAPGFDQVADELGLPAAKRRMVARALESRRFLSEVLDTAGSRPFEMATACHAPPEAGLEATEEQATLRDRLGRLDDRERRVVTLRYGLGGGQPKTLREVGRSLGVTREWVRRIELRAIRKMGDPDPQLD